MGRLPNSVLRAFRGAASRHRSGSCLTNACPSSLALVSSLQAASAVLSCSSITSSIQQSSSSSFSHARSASSQAPLMRIQQQQQQSQQGNSSSSGTPWGKLLAGGAAAAAAAAAGWAVWSESDAARRAQALAEASTRGSIPRCSLATQGAVVSCYAGPLISLLHGTSPSEAQLQEMTVLVTQDASLLTPWELVNSIWGLAMFGADLSQQQKQLLAAAAATQIDSMTAYQAIVATWALLLLCSGLQEVCSSCWRQLLEKLEGCSLQEMDEGCVLYLLHAAMQRASLQEGAAAGSSPRASEAEVLQLLGQLPKAMTARVAAAYKEYVPFQQYIEGPFLVILHIAKALPSQINAAAAAARDTSSSSSPYQVAYGGFSAADADAASTLVANSSLLSKLRRSLYFGWRSDELLDRHQDDLNQVMHVLSRRLLLLPVQQSPDIDVVLPSLKAALLLDDDLSPAAAAPSSSSSNKPQQQQSGAGPSSSSNSSSYLAACHDALSVLMRNRYAAPPGGFQAKSTPGIRAAKARCLQQRGWRVVHVKLSEVEACMGGPSAGAGQRRKPRDLAAGHTALEALLRARLKDV